MPSVNVPLSAVLRKCRHDARVTMGDCARCLRIRVTEYSDMESGKRVIYARDFQRLNRLFRMTMWLVGQFRGRKRWEFQGVFDSREKAIKACRTDRYFIVPVIVNQELPHETVSHHVLTEYPKRG